MKRIHALALMVTMLPPARAETRFHPLNLADHFNNDAVATREQPGDGGFDGIGTTQPATFNFSEEGWPEEDAPNLGGVPFRLGSIAPGANNNVIAEGQTIAVPRGNYSALYILAAATNGSYSAEWAAHYASGPDRLHRVRVSDWCVGPGPGEVAVIRSRYRYFAGGGPSPDCAPMVYAQRIDLDESHSLTAIVLPRQANTHVFGLTLASGAIVEVVGLPPLPLEADVGPVISVISDAADGTLVLSPGPARLTVRAERLPANATEAILLVGEGGTIAQMRLSVHDGAARADVAARLEVPGYHPITLSAGGVTLASGVVVLPEDNAPAWRPDSPFGMNEGLSQEDPRKAATVARLMRRAGVRWVRQGFDWGRLQPEPDQWNWGPFDRSLRAARAERLHTLGLLAYWAGWTAPFTDEGYARFAAYARRVADRYGSVTAWEVWNEPNIFYWKGTRDQYVTLLNAATGAINTSRPGARVVGVDAAFSDIPFLRGVLNAGARPDIVSMHPYRAAGPDALARLDVFDGGREERTLAGETRGLLRAIQETAGSLPLWFTEVGWWTAEAHGGVSERRQADYLAQTYVISLAEGVEKVFWYAFVDAGSKPDYDQHHFGIVRPDLSPKPAYAAYATIARLLEGAVFEGRLPVPDPVQAHRFGRGIERVTALWSRSGQHRITLPVGSPARLMRWDGAPLPAALEAGRLVVEVGESPVYVVERAGE